MAGFLTLSGTVAGEAGELLVNASDGEREPAKKMDNTII